MRADAGPPRNTTFDQMMRITLQRAAVVLAALLASTPSPAQDSADAAVAVVADSSWREHAQAGEAARNAGDWGAWRYHLVRMREEVGYHPNIVYSLARADARLGRSEDALAWLQTFAATGLTRDVAADSAFFAMHGSPAWTALVERIAGNARPVSSAQPAFALTDSAFLPESITFDPQSQRFFLSSIRDGRIIACTPADGAFRELVPAGRDGQWAMLALVADSATRTLWATTAAIPFYGAYQAADSGRSAVLAYDLDTGALRRRWDAPAGGRHQLGDLTLAPDGDVYVSDADEGAVYRIARGGTELERFAADGLVSPQGLALASDGRRVFVADYVRGIASLDRESGEVTWMEVADSMAVSGIDGLVRVGHSLVAVQNGVTPKRVIELRMDDGETRITGWRAIESGTPVLTEPTHAVVVGGEVFFIADSGWDRLNADGSIKPGMVLEPAHVLRARVR
jgi:SMP-30/Gluconolactonase/LRE-like region